MYQNLFDSHTHSDNSHDGHAPISLLCEAASEKGLAGLAITDHCECDDPKLNMINRFAPLQFEILKAQAAFRDQIMVCCGIELGQPIYDVTRAEELLSKYKFDFVLGSLHNLPGRDDFCKWDFHECEEQIPALLQEYYECMLKLAQWNKFDSLSHMTYPLRYIQGIQQIPVDMKPYQELIREILKTVAQNGKAIEINTSTLRQGLGVTMPGIETVKLFKELGGEYVTIGSDAHYAKHIGADLEVGMDMLKDCGFEYFTVFRRREPKLLKIL